MGLGGLVAEGKSARGVGGQGCYVLFLQIIRGKGLKNLAAPSPPVCRSCVFERGEMGGESIGIFEEMNIHPLNPPRSRTTIRTGGLLGAEILFGHIELNSPGSWGLLSPSGRVYPYSIFAIRRLIPEW